MAICRDAVNRPGPLREVFSIHTIPRPPPPALELRPTYAHPEGGGARNNYASRRFGLLYDNASIMYLVLIARHGTMVIVLFACAMSMLLISLMPVSSARHT